MMNAEELKKSSGKKVIEYFQDNIHDEAALLSLLNSLSDKPPSVE